VLSAAKPAVCFLHGWSHTAVKSCGNCCNHLLAILQDDGRNLPAPIQANISSGLLHILGLDIPLPIRGTGQFEVAWLDSNMRVFKSSGAVTVQIRQQYLEDAGLLQ
jgi:hypothetical protein